MTSEAQQGMVLALPVPNPTDPSHLLLRPGYELDKFTITRLNKLAIRYLWVRYPNFAFIEDYIDSTVLRTQAQAAKKLHKVFSDIESQITAKLDFSSYTRAVGEMVISLLSNRTAGMYFEQIGDNNPSMLNHSLRVSYLSVLMGTRLEGYIIGQRKSLSPWLAKQITNLGIGAALHDFGYNLIDDKARQHYEETCDENNEMWRQHTKLGYDTLKNHIDPSARVIVLQHHQHFDGSGFPAASNNNNNNTMLMGEQIHIYARIVCVANTFDRLRFPPNTTAIPAVVALWRMLQPPLLHWFDPEVLRIFMDICPAYPPGVLVELSDGRLAVPVQHHGNDPCNPTVQIIGKSDQSTTDLSNGIADEFIDLRDTSCLRIVKIEDEYVDEYNFTHQALAQYVNI